MSGESIFTGKSVDEAIAEGLRALGLTADTAEIEVISRGSRGIFGLGSEPAQVRITRRRPVSYTHLDVYKRQARYRISRR